MLSRLHLTEEEKRHRRQMTNFAVKLLLVVVGGALIMSALCVVMKYQDFCELIPKIAFCTKMSIFNKSGRSLVLIRIC
jgi:hypothetical protein